MADKDVKDLIKRNLNAYKLVEAVAKDAEEKVRTLEAKRDLSSLVSDSAEKGEKYYDIDNDPEYKQAKEGVKQREVLVGKVGASVRDNLDKISDYDALVEAAAFSFEHDEKTAIGSLFQDYILYSLANIEEPKTEKEAKAKEGAYRKIISEKLKDILADGIREAGKVKDEEEIRSWASLASLCADKNFVDRAIPKQYKRAKEKIKGIGTNALVAYIKEKLGDKPEAYVKFAEHLVESE